MPDMFLIIKSGTLSLETSKDECLKLLSAGDTIEDNSLLYHASLAFTGKTLTRCYFWGFGLQMFDSFVEITKAKHYYYIKQSFYGLPCLQFLRDQQKSMLIDHVYTLRLKEGQLVFRKNQPSLALYFIIIGKVEISIPQKQPVIFQRGQSFGESCLKPQQCRVGDSICTQNSIILSIDSKSIINCLGQKSNTILSYNIIKWSFMRCKIFKNIPKHYLDKIISHGKIQYYQRGQIVSKKNVKPQYLIICIEGSINGKGAGSIFNLEEGFFPSSKVTQDLIQSSNGSNFIITFQLLKQIFGKSMRSLRKQLLLLKNTDLQSIVNFKTLKLNQLFFYRSISNQEYSTTLAVIDPINSESIYSIKCFYKNKIINLNKQNTLISYKQNWQKIQCYFFSRLYRTFIDQNYIYFLYKYYEGGTLRSYFNKNRVIIKSYIQFIIASLFLGVEYLHSNNILHGNITLKKVSIDQQGYIVYNQLPQSTFFNTQIDKNGEIHYMLSQVYYMSPQTIKKKTLPKSNDIWSIGVIFYELVSGFLPYEKLKDSSQLYSQIINNKLVFPTFYQDQDGRNLIRMLLNINEQERTKIKLDSIKSHPYFNNFDWVGLSNRQLKSPFHIPTKNYQSIIDIQINLQQALTSNYINSSTKTQKYLLSQWEKIFEV